MKIFLFVVDGKPGYRQTLHEAQAVLEDHFRDRRDVSDVWWDDNRPYEARLYLHNSSHTDVGKNPKDPYENLDFETTDKIIWLGHLPSPEVTRERLDPLLSGGAEMVLSVTTDEGKSSMTRRIPKAEWDADWKPFPLRPHILLSFATNAAQSIAADWIKRESS